MQYEDTIEIRDVTVMRQTDVGLLCRMGNQHRWIAPTQFQPGSTVARQGDVGIIVLKRPFAVEQGLVPLRAPPLEARILDRTAPRRGSSMSESLGLILLKAGVVTPAELIEAHGLSGGEPLARRLVALGMATEEQIEKAVATHLETRSRSPLQPSVWPPLRKFPRFH